MTRRWCLIMTFILQLAFVSALAEAAPVRLPSGQTFEMTSKQLGRLKHEPGVAFFPYPPPEEITGDKITPLPHIKIPAALDGGFLIGTPENRKKGLDAVGAHEIDKEKKGDDSAKSPSTTQKDVGGTTSKFLLRAGYRTDDLDWSIAGNTAGENPNILSELTWRDLEIYQVKLGNVTMIPKMIYFRGALTYGWIVDGENQDSDFDGDDRTLEWSRSNNSGDDGNVFDASFGIGFPFIFGQGKVSIAPLIGYSYHEQNLRISDGYQTVETAGRTIPIGPFQGLDSSYDAEWNGPWLGVDFFFRLKKKHAVYAAAEYHWADYYAVADWNLRSDYEHPKSFEHEADGDGIVVSAGWTYLFRDNWTLDVTLDFQSWSTNHGIDRVFFASGTTAETRLNEVNWESFAVMAGLAYQF